MPLSAEKHDRITADTQAVTHAAFLSMGTAWQANKQFPWEIPRYLGGIENVSIPSISPLYALAVDTIATLVGHPHKMAAHTFTPGQD